MCALTWTSEKKGTSWGFSSPVSKTDPTPPVYGCTLSLFRSHWDLPRSSPGGGKVPSLSRRPESLFGQNNTPRRGLCGVKFVFIFYKRPFHPQSLLYSRVEIFSFRVVGPRSRTEITGTSHDSELCGFVSVCPCTWVCPSQYHTCIWVVVCLPSAAWVHWRVWAPLTDKGMSDKQGWRELGTVGGRKGWVIHICVYTKKVLRFFTERVGSRVVMSKPTFFGERKFLVLCPWWKCVLGVVLSWVLSNYYI